MCATCNPPPSLPPPKINIIAILDKLIYDHEFWEKYGYFPEDITIKR